VAGGAVTYVSVVIPSRDTAATLGEQLDALAAQTYRGEWEVVVADNGSTDGSDALALRWCDRLPLRVIRVATPGIVHVRNAGLAQARGDLLAFCDGDDVASPGWLAALVQAAEDADLVAGRLDDTTLNPPDVVAGRGALPADGPLVPLGFLPLAPGANFAVRRAVAEALGGWDASYVGGSEDVDFSWRAQLAGYRFAYAPDAVMAYRYRPEPRALYRQFYRYGVTEARLQRVFADHLPKHSVRNLLGTWKALLRLGVSEVATRREWAYHLGHLRGSISERVILP
jgi:glycosyltransferase involved in cell wall biosynthesis